jgi:uncharacterized protein YggE
MIGVYFYSRLLVSLAAIGLFSACSQTPRDPRGVDHGETLLTVSATGRAEAAPDQALFTAGLSSIAPSAQAASLNNSETMAKITASLSTLGIDKRDLQTRNLSVNRIEYGKNRGQYEASNTISIRVRKVDAVGQAIAAVTASGANIVSGPNLSLADPEKAELGAYGVAYKAARAKAQAYAEASSMQIARVLTIQDGGEGGAMRPIGDAMEANAMAPPPVTQSAAPPVMAGTNTSLVTVRVSFALTPK